MTPLERILQALREHGIEARLSGNDWMCRCPAHDDHDPSLGIDEAPEKPCELTLRAHPNPFNSALYITHDRDTDVQILDLRGMHIATVPADRNRWGPAPGTPSGVYLLRSERNGQAKVERVMYIR